MWFLTLSVLYILFYSRYKGSGSKAGTQCRNMCNTAVCDIESKTINFLLYLTPTPSSPHLCTWWWLRSCTNSLVFMHTASSAQFSPAGPEAVCKAALLASGLGETSRMTAQRKKEPPTGEEWDWSLARQPGLGGPAAIHLTFFQRVSTPIRNPPPPSSLSSFAHPPCIHFWTCRDSRISRELSKQAALLHCNVRWVLFGTLCMSVFDDCRLPLHRQHL